MLDPTGFHQNFEDVSWAEMENFGLQRLVNRNPGIVEYVLINGKIAVSHGEVISELGSSMGFGQFIAAT